MDKSNSNGPCCKIRNNFIKSWSTYLCNSLRRAVCFLHDIQFPDLFHSSRQWCWKYFRPTFLMHQLKGEGRKKLIWHVSSLLQTSSLISSLGANFPKDHKLSSLAKKISGYCIFASLISFFLASWVCCVSHFLVLHLLWAIQLSSLCFQSFKFLPDLQLVKCWSRVVKTLLKTFVHIGFSRFRLWRFVRIKKDTHRRM